MVRAVVLGVEWGNGCGGGASILARRHFCYERCRLQTVQGPRAVRTVQGPAKAVKNFSEFFFRNGDGFFPSLFFVFLSVKGSLLFHFKE